MQLICKRKRGLGNDHTVKVLPTPDVTSAPFVSVPIRFLGSEAGTINILGFEHSEIESSHIVALEQYAKVVGQKLEAIKLKELSSHVRQKPNYFGTWKQFESEASSILCSSTEHHCINKIELSSLDTIEEYFGVDMAIQAEDRFISLASQLSRSNYLVTRGPKASLYLLCPKREVDSYVSRLRALLKRALPGTEFSANKKVAEASRLASEGLSILTKEVTDLSDIRAIVSHKEEELPEVVNG